jgi:hypothetical protein
MLLEASRPKAGQIGLTRQVGLAEQIDLAGQIGLAFPWHIVIPTTINKQRRAQEMSKGRASKVFVYKRFP